MTDALERIEQPGERELHEARREVEALEAQFAQVELDLASVTAALEAFGIRHDRRIGPVLAELTRLEALIARLLADLNPNDAERQEQASEAEHTAQQSQDHADQARSDDGKPPTVAPDENLKRLYKQAAKLFHPDLARDDADRRARTAAMADANVAFTAADSQHLQAIIDAWETGHPAPDASADHAQELARLRRRAELLRTAIDNARDQVKRTNESDLAQLRERVIEADAVDHDLLGEIERELRQEVTDASDRLAALA